MNKRFWPGVVLGSFLLLSNSIFADSVRDTNEMRTRWSVADERNNTEILAFTSTFSANAAASLMEEHGRPLSFTSFGRVPFYQVATISHRGNLTSSSNSSTALPEPTSLLLLGSGLAALATRMRKQLKKTEK
jgi:hypothetical protein